MVSATESKKQKAVDPVNEPSTKTDQVPNHRSGFTAATSSLSIVVALVALCTAGLGPFFMLHVVPSIGQFCSLTPALCQNSYLMSSHTADRTFTQYSPTISLEFINRLPMQIDAFWKDYSGQEQFWFSMEPNSYTGNISSIRGHVWSFRESLTKELLFEEVVTQDHCGKIHIAPLEHIEALRQYCASTGRAVIGYWPRAPLVRHVPAPSPLGSQRTFLSDFVQFESYEGRLQSGVKEMTIETISTKPHMLRIDNFLSEEECEHLKEVSEGRLQMHPAHPLDASSTWLEHGESPIVSAITKRLFDLMGYDADIQTFYFAEKIQVSRFGHRQEYLPHYDAMDFTTSQFAFPHNRYATAMMYLNSLKDDDGGEDVWPRADGADEFANAPCDSAFRLRAHKGSLIVMYSMLADGVLDEASLHGSCPIKTADGEKWTANLYFWDPFVQWSVERYTTEVL